MIRLVYLLRRRAGLTPSEFSAHWRDVHGPLVAGHQNRLGILRYTQTHRDPTCEDAETDARQKRGGMEPPYDGVAEMWFRSDEALAAARMSDAGHRAEAELIADAAQFIDLAASPFWFAHEYPQVSMLRERTVARHKTGIIKIHFSLRPLPGLTTALAQHYWRTAHGPLVRSHAVARGTLCYQQVHRYDSALVADMRLMRGTTAEDYIGHAEAWFDRLIVRAGPEAADAEAAALGDEQHFIDWTRSSLLIGKELIFVERDWL